MPPSRFVSRLVASLLVAASLLGGGCASIVHGGFRTVSIASDPAGARVLVRKWGGPLVAEQTTPCAIQLEPKGRYFQGQSYLVRIEMAGYRPAIVALRPSVSGWYFANLALGGLIGMLVVDPLTGAMWNIQPKNIDRTLTPAQAAVIRSHNGFLVVLSSNLAPSERAHLVKVPPLSDGEGTAGTTL